MEFGNYLRQCRENTKRTQPDVAAEIEIEQSYLSKLESGKSLPSEEVFNKLQQVYSIDLNEMVKLLSPQELIKLADIKSIREVTSRKNNRQLHGSRKWSVVGLLMLMVGVGCFAIAVVPWQSTDEYFYRSEGVLKVDEDLNAFELVYKDLETLKNDKGQLDKRTALLVRLDQKDLVTDQDRGDGYLKKTQDGRRFYKLTQSRTGERSHSNRWFMVPALMLLAGAIGCFVIARRWD